MGSVTIAEELRVGRKGTLVSAALVSGDSGIYLVSKGTLSFSLWSKVVSAFLPEGYPNSVTPDYLSFQFWDTMQGLSTYIRSMLSTQALLVGIGVGEATATAVGATFQWFLRDFTGMLGGICFTLYQGSNLDNQAKQWRLTADFLNDIGMLMDLISPLFPGAFIALLCIGSMARAITGVASGATRAALTQHFAVCQNAADVAAKEGSQETAATMLGMLLGMLLARLTSGNAGMIWFFFLLLTAFHMYANYRAVRSLCLSTLNAERIQILLENFVAEGKILTPKEVSTLESILPQFLGSKKFRSASRKNIVFGAKLTSLCLNKGWDSLPSLMKKFSKEHYLMARHNKVVQVVLHSNAESKHYLRAYIHALLVVNQAWKNAEAEGFSWMSKFYPTFLASLKTAGWSTEKVLVSPLEWRATWSSDANDKLN